MRRGTSQGRRIHRLYIFKIYVKELSCLINPSSGPTIPENGSARGDFPGATVTRHRVRKRGGTSALPALEIVGKQQAFALMNWQIVPIGRDVSRESTASSGLVGE